MYRIFGLPLSHILGIHLPFQGLNSGCEFELVPVIITKVIINQLKIFNIDNRRQGHVLSQISSGRRMG